MKNLGLLLKFFFAFSVVVSCTDEHTVVQQKIESAFSVYFIDGILKFKSVESFTSLVENQDPKAKESFIKFTDQQKNYSSLKKSYQAIKNNNGSRIFAVPEVEIIETNEFLSSLLNEDGMISIGNYNFKVNLERELVFLLLEEHRSQMDDLKNENMNNRNIRVFSTSEDVLWILTEQDYTTSANGRTEICFRGRYANRDEDTGFAYSPFVENVRQDNKVVYQKAGIYFSLQSKTKMQKEGWTGIWGSHEASDQRIRYYADFKPRCQGWINDQGEKVDDGNDNELNYRPYERTRALERYYFEAFFYGGGFWSQGHVIED
ncbi:MAG: hypothetical protein MUC38_12755 [Cyclobacteriaceae bacterium]|jgi:hypothetical protein|nr:hypothetical protein [Cyclobacteriaceae bacterium]